MDYLLGVLYATKRYEMLDTSRVHQGSRAAFSLSVAPPSAFYPNEEYADADVGPSDANNSCSMITAAANRLSHMTPTDSGTAASVPPSSTPQAASGTVDSAMMEALAAAPRTSVGPGTSSISVERASTGAGGLGRGSSVLPSFSRDSRRVSTVLPPESAASPLVQPLSRDSALLSPLLPGLLLPSALMSGGGMDGGTAVVPAGGGGAGANVPFARPQRLEYSVPTKMLAGKYVLLYLPAPHRAAATTTGGAATASVAPGSHAAGGGMNASSSSPSGGGGGGGASAGRGASTASPQIEALRARTPPIASPLTTPHASPGRSSFSGAMPKSMDGVTVGGGGVSASGGGNSLHSSGQRSSHAAMLGTAIGVPLTPSAARATASAAATHQKLLLFYSLLLHRLTQRGDAERSATGFFEGEEAAAPVTSPGVMASSEVAVAVLELHYTTDGPLRNNVFVPASAAAAAASSSAAMDTHTAAASAATGSGAVTTAGAGGATGTSSSGTGAGAAANTTTSTTNTASTSGGVGSTGAGGLPPFLPLAATLSGGRGGPGSTTACSSAAGSPRLGMSMSMVASLAFDGTTAGDLPPGPEATSIATQEVLAHAAPAQLLRRVLHSLRNEQPDPALSNDNVVFDSDITQNPYYGGWYAVESNDGYRRVMQLCGIRSWPAVVLIDPAGCTVTVSALQRVEDELAKFEVAVEAEIAKAATARATALAEVKTAAAAPAEAPLSSRLHSARNASSSPPPPCRPMETSESAAGFTPAPQLDRPLLERQTTATHQTTATQITWDDDGMDATASPSPSLPRNGQESDTPSFPPSSRLPMHHPRSASSSPVMPQLTTDDREKSMVDRSSTNPLAATVEGALTHSSGSPAAAAAPRYHAGAMTATDTVTADHTMDNYSTTGSSSSTDEEVVNTSCTPNRVTEDGAEHPGIAGLREPSMRTTDPRVLTAEPTPVKEMPLTARYREAVVDSPTAATEMATRRLSLSPQADGGGPSSAPPSADAAGRFTTATNAVAAASTYFSGAYAESEASPKSESATAPGTNRSPHQSGDVEEGHDSHEQSSSLNARPMTNLSMPVLETALNVASAATNTNGSGVLGDISISASPSFTSTTRGFAPLPSWNTKAVPTPTSTTAGNNVVLSPTIAATAALTSPQMSTPGHASSPEVQPTSANRGRAAATGGVDRDPLAKDPSVPVLARSCGYGDTVRSPVRDSVSSFTPPLPPLILPAFDSAFPWNHVMAEPILVCASPASAAGNEKALDEVEDEVGSTHAAFQQHLRERIRRGSRPASVGRQASLQRSRGAMGDGLAPLTHTDDAPAGVSGSGRVAHLPPAVVTPATMVLRQGTPISSNLLYPADTVESPIAPGGEGVDGQSVYSGPHTTATATALSHNRPNSTTARLELTTFAKSSPLTQEQRRLPVHPLRRLSFCAITVAAARARAMRAADGPLVAEGLINASTAGGAAAVLNRLTSDLPTNAEVSSMSNGDSTDEDRNSLPRSPSPTSARSRQPQRPTLHVDTAEQKASVLLLEGWLQEATTKLGSYTHLLLLFGAGWHPGMPKCIQALRKLCAAVNTPACTEGGRGAAVDAEDALFASLNAGMTSQRDYFSGGGAGLGSGGLTGMRGFGAFSADGAGGGAAGTVEEDEAGDSLMLDESSLPRRRMDSMPPSALTAGVSGRVEEDRSGATAAGAGAEIGRRYRAQVMYISADETPEDLAKATANMPEHWLCLSPCVAQSATERQLQTQAGDIARSFIHVTSFPRLAVIELPTGPSASPPPNQENSSAGAVTGAMSSGAGSCSSSRPAKQGQTATTGSGDVESEEEEGLLVATTGTGTSETQQLQQQQQQLEGLWAVVQLHGEAQLYTDPEGKRFPWSYGEDDVLLITQDTISSLPREGHQAWSCLLNGFRQQQQQQQLEETIQSGVSLHGSPELGFSCPDDAEEASLVQSHLELATTAGKDREDVEGSEEEEQEEEDGQKHDNEGGEERMPTLALSIARRFPPVKPFLLGNGEVLRLLSRGGYFVVLGAFGSVEASIHRQCAKALDEARVWFYAEVEARKTQAWLEPTRLQVMAPHRTYTTTFNVGGDRVTLSPAAGTPLPESDFGSGGRFTPVGASNAPAALRPGYAGPAPGARAGTPFLGDDLWPEPHGQGLGTSPKAHLVRSPPLNNTALGPPLDGSFPALHGAQLPHSVLGPGGVSGNSAGGGANNGGSPPITAQSRAPLSRPLPSAFFYDSVLTRPAATAAIKVQARKDTAVAAAAMAMSSGGLGPWRHGSPPVPSPNDEDEPSSSLHPHDAGATARPIADNTASLRRHHAKDLALLQEYVLAPILESDERMLPVREGELFLAVVRWPQRAAVVLRRRLASEVRHPPAAGPGVSQASTSTAAGSGTASSYSLSAGSTPLSVSVSPASTAAGSGFRAASASQSPGQPHLPIEPLPRRSSLTPNTNTITTTTNTTAAGSPSLGSPLAGVAYLNPPVSAERTSPSMTAANVPTPTATSLSATLRTEGSGKEGSPDPDATPLASVESIKSFLYEHILRSMDV